MKVLITGGMGVMGAETSRKFVKEGFRPVIFARTRKESLIRDIVDKVDIELGDVTDLPSLLHAIKKHEVTHIVHVAALVSGYCAANPPQAVQVNCVGTVNVLEAARLFNIKRVVYTSAKGTYGPLKDEYGYPTYKPISEEHSRNPQRMYDGTKYLGENACNYYAEAFGLDTVSLLFGTTYAPGKGALGVHGLIGRIIEQPVHGKPFRLEKGGDERDDFVYNKDSAQGIFLATVTEKLHHRVYNIATGVGATIKDFATAVRKVIPTADIEVGDGLAFFEKPYMYGIFDISRARADLGYKPQYLVEQGVADYIESMRRMGI